MNTQELANAVDGTPIPSFTGQVVSCYQKIGPGQHGDFKQNLRVRDAFGECYLVLAGKSNQVEDTNSVVGKTITVTSSQGQRGLTGVKVKLNSYQGKNDNRVWVTDSAKIAYTGIQQAAPSGQQRSAQPSAPRNNRQGTVVSPDAAKAHAETWVHTYELVAPIFAKVLEKEQIPPLVTSILISAQRGELFAGGEKDWRSFVINKQGVTLGVLPLDKLCAVIPKLLVKSPDCSEAVEALRYVVSLGTIEDALIKCITTAYTDKQYSIPKFSEFIASQGITTVEGLADAMKDEGICLAFVDDAEDEAIDISV